MKYVHDRYLDCWHAFARLHFSHQRRRVEDIMDGLDHVRSALYTEKNNSTVANRIILFQVRVTAKQILESKMFYVPFLLNSPYLEVIRWWNHHILLCTPPFTYKSIPNCFFINCYTSHHVYKIIAIISFPSNLLLISKMTFFPFLKNICQRK